MRGQFPWEFGYVVDQDLRETGFVVVRGRVRTADHRQFLRHLARDYRVLGMTCQGVFPMIGDLPGNLPGALGVREGRDEEYLDHIEAWAYCFRDPDDYLPPAQPRILFANADNLDAGRIWRLATCSGPLEKRWDYVYSCMPERSNFIRKNWEMAKRLVVRFADELGLRGILVGLTGVADVPVHPLIEVSPQLKWHDFLRVLGESRVAFFPNTHDPAPRGIGEALCLDVPVLVNREILGGWHLVAAETGRFFAGLDDAVQTMAELLLANHAAREWYISHHGPVHAGRRLAKFINQVALAHDSSGASQVQTASFYSPRDYRAWPPRPYVSPRGHLTRGSIDVGGNAVSTSREPSPRPASRGVKHRLPFEAFGLKAEVVSDDPALFELLPSALPPGWRRGTHDGGVQFGLMRSGAITFDGEPVAWFAGNRNEAVERLGVHVRHYLAQFSPRHLFIHAGVVGIDRRAIVIPGRSLSGKTTLVRELVKAGASYYSDEYAVVDALGLIHAYPKPLSIRRSRSGHGLSVPVRAAQVGQEPLRAGLIVVTTYERGAAWAPVARTPAQGIIDLLRNTVAVRSRPAETLATANHLVRDAPVIAGPRGEARAVVDPLFERMKAPLRHDDRAGVEA